MNYYQGQQNIQNPFSDLKGFFKSRNMLAKLIIINVVVWLAIMFLDVVFDLFNSSVTDSLIEWLAVPASAGKLITRPWTIFTYMFLHYDFWHIIFNMLWLFWFGKIFLEYLNQRQLLATYLFGGIAGAILFILAFNIFPKFQDVYIQSVALGASASVMAIVVGISYYVPNYKINLMFLGPVKILYIALFSIIMDIMMIRSTNAGGHLAHLGGAMWGLYYIYMLKKGTDFSTLLNKIPRIKFSGGNKSYKKTKFKNVYTNERPVTDEDYNFRKKNEQERIDAILDKISKSGYESLNKEEKALLFKSSGKK
ncbi:rhomboid family intramembrane serine protease [Desulfosarcina sp.]|nr:rhomboid family intramembrane serine protease [Desulfosarcina sp.]